MKAYIFNVEFYIDIKFKTKKTGKEIGIVLNRYTVIGCCLFLNNFILYLTDFYMLGARFASSR